MTLANDGQGEGFRLYKGRGECKRSGGKLVAVTVGVCLDGDGRAGNTGRGRIVTCGIDGDFFIDGSRDLTGPGRSPGPEGSRRPFSGTPRRDLAHGGEGQDLLRDLEGAVRATPLPLEPAKLEGDLRAVMDGYPEAAILGITAWDIVTALTRALAQAVDGSRGPAAPAPDSSQGGERAPAGGRASADEGRWMGPDWPDGFVKRWGDLDLVLIRDRPRDPVMQMAVDQALAEGVAEGQEPPTLRLWSWSAPAVVIGRFQSLGNEVDRDAARRLGFTVVRRTTGGGAMFVEPDRVITYSLYLPASFVEGLDVASSYRLCDLWLIRGLNLLGVRAGWQGMNDIASPRGKMGGASQRRLPSAGRGPGGILHHVTLSHTVDAAKMSHVLKVSKEKLSDKAVTSARRRVDPISSQTGLSRAGLVDGLLDTLPGLVRSLSSGTVDPDTMARAGSLAAGRYSDPAWTSVIV